MYFPLLMTVVGVSHLILTLIYQLVCWLTLRQASVSRTWFLLQASNEVHVWLDFPLSILQPRHGEICLDSAEGSVTHGTSLELNGSSQNFPISTVFDIDPLTSGIMVLQTMTHISKIATLPHTPCCMDLFCRLNIKTTTVEVELSWGHGGPQWFVGFLVILYLSTDFCLHVF